MRRARHRRRSCCRRSRRAPRRRPRRTSTSPPSSTLTVGQLHRRRPRRGHAAAGLRQAAARVALLRRGARGPTSWGRALRRLRLRVSLQPSGAADGALRREDRRRRPRSLWGTRVGRYRDAVRPLQPQRPRLHRVSARAAHPLWRLLGAVEQLPRNRRQRRGRHAAAVRPKSSLGIPQDEDDLHRAPRLRPRRPRAGHRRRRDRRRQLHPHPAVQGTVLGARATPSSPASTRAGCAAASSCAASGSTATRSRARGRSAATPT